MICAYPMYAGAGMDGVRALVRIMQARMPPDEPGPYIMTAYLVDGYDLYYTLQDENLPAPKMPERFVYAGSYWQPMDETELLECIGAALVKYSTSH